MKRGTALGHGTIVAATRDEELIAALRSLDGDIEIELVPSADDVFAKVSDGGIKIVLVDGDAAMLARIRRERPEVKTIVAAAPENEVEIRRQGAYYFLPKPVDGGILAKVVAKAIAHESSRMQVTE